MAAQVANLSRVRGVTVVLLVLLAQHADHRAGRTAAAAAAARVPPDDDAEQQQQLPPVEPPDRLYGRMAGLVVPHGFPLEEHFVETVDGYILRMFRIPAGRQEHAQQQRRSGLRVSRLRRLLGAPGTASAAAQGPAAAAVPAAVPAAPTTAGSSRPRRNKQRKQQRQPGNTKPVVLIQHGLLGSSTDFVLNGPENSLPLLLADAGWDVWLGNVRGNVFSRNHTTLDLLDERFWQFSWDEMASRDLPAMMTRALLASGAPSLSYVGHSQGTTVAMAFLSHYAGSALAERIEVAVLLAPVAFVTHMDSLPMTTLATLQTDEIFTLLGFHEFLPSSEVVSKLEGQMCTLQPYLCVNLLSLLCGYNPDNLDVDALPTYLNYTPSGTSVKNMAKWAQAVRETQPDVLRAFDYGTTCRTFLDLPNPCNQAVYGQLTPPVYDLSAIRVPLVLFTGGQDILADPIDTELLVGQLGDSVVQRHHEPSYGHLDFIWGYNARERVYERTRSALASHSRLWRQRTRRAAAAPLPRSSRSTRRQP